MGLGPILAGAGRINRQYEQDVSSGLIDSTRMLVNQGMINALRESERMERARQSMADMPRFDYEGAMALPSTVVTPGSVQQATAPAPTPAPAPSAVLPQATARQAQTAGPKPAAVLGKVDDQNGLDVGWNPITGSSAVPLSPARPFGNAGILPTWQKLGDFFGGVWNSMVKGYASLDELGKEAQTQAQLPQTQQQGRTAPPQTQAQLPQTQQQGRTAPPQTQAQLPQTQQQGRTAPQAPFAGTQTTFATSSPQASAQTRMLDLQARQLAHTLESWQRAGAPAGMQEMALKAQSGLMELAIKRVGLETEYAISNFEQGGDPTTAVALLNHVTGKDYVLYQHPQNPQVVALGPRGAQPAQLKWGSPTQLATAMRTMTNQQFQNYMWTLQAELAKKAAETRGKIEEEMVKGDYGILNRYAEANAKARAPQVQTVNIPGGGQVIVLVDPTTNTGVTIDPAAPGPKIGEETLPSRPRVTRFGVVPQQQPQPQPQPQLQQQNGRLIVPGYR